MALRERDSGAESSRELFKRSKDKFSSLHSKKFFWLEGVDFL